MPTSDSRQSLWLAWLPALIWLGLIFLESHDAFSAQHTGHILRAIITWLFGPVDPVVLDFVNAALRKTGHVIGYAMLSLLLFRAWRATIHVTRPSAWTVRWASISFVMTAAVATLDEWHQASIPSRTGTVYDVALDTAAALAIQFLIFAFLWNRQPHPASS